VQTNCYRITPKLARGENGMPVIEFWRVNFRTLWQLKTLHCPYLLRDSFWSLSQALTELLRAPSTYS
jgi:hypothetical protein